MIFLSVSHLKKAFGINVILEDITFTVQKGQKIGIIGSNGAGKTTLANIIAGLSEADGGSISMPGDTSIGYMEQATASLSGDTVWGTLQSVYDPVFAAEKRLRELEEQMGELHGDEAAYSRLLTEYDRLSSFFEQSDGFSYQSRITGVLTGLGFTRAQYDQPVETLSGGEQTRLMLGTLLLKKPDLLILDEPTNHLDLSAAQWLQDYLRGYTGTLLAISHDRYFLDAVCDGIISMSRGTCRQYQGNYTKSMAQRDEDYRQALKAYELQQAEIQRQEEIIARYKMYNTEASHVKARSREKALDRMEKLDKPQGDEASIRFGFSLRGTTGQDVLMAENISAAYPGGPVLFSDFNLHIRAGDRVAMIGPNGIGKTTLLKVLMGQLPQRTGSVRHGAGVRIGYYDQQFAALHPEKIVIDEIWDDYPTMTQTDVRNVLGSFLFRGDDVFQPVETLSGGEKGRLMLLKLMLRRDNFLLLDEPTNHLDMQSREVLENALAQFDGTLLFVSHDRYFINRIADRVIEISDSGTAEYIGNYDDYLEQKQRLEAPPEEAAPAVTKTAQRAERQKERAQRQAEKKRRESIAQLEENISSLEKKIEETEALLADPAVYSDSEKAASTARLYNSLKEELERAYAEWAEASEQQ